MSSKSKPVDFKIIYLAWAILIFLVLIIYLIDLNGAWRNARGYEYEWVAQSLAGGFGYSFDSPHRWLFPEDDLNTSPNHKYYPTAWVEPGYTLIIAGIFKLFGQDGRLVLVILQTIGWYATALVIVYLAMQVFNAWTGILAGSLLIFIPVIKEVAQQSLGNFMLAGLMVTVSAILIFWCLEKVSPLRGMLLGLGLGVASLIHGVIFIFVPVAVFFIFLSRDVAFRRKLMTLIVLFVTVLFVLTPWFSRNLIVFHQFVPLRDGFGFNSYIGNPLLVEAYRPKFQACSFPVEVEVKILRPWEAVQATEQTEVQRALYERAYQCMQGTTKGNFISPNEAARDREYLKGTIAFILKWPLLWFEVTIYKSLLLFGGSPGRSVISFLAIIGLLLAIENKRAIILFILILVYTVPYLLAIPFYYRYRYPIEPLLLLFASSAIVYVIGVGLLMFKGKIRPLS